MDDEDKLRKTITNGHRAQTLLDDPMIKATLEAMEADLLAGFRAGAQDESSRYWALLKAYDEFVRRLEAYAANGRDAMREVERLNLQARHDRHRDN